MKVPSLLVLMVIGLSLSAQTFEFDNSNLNAVYRNLFQQNRAALQEYGYPVERDGNSAVAKDQFMIMLEGSETSQADALRQEAMATYGNRFAGYRSCGCDGSFRVEVWQIDNVNGNERGKTGRDKVAENIGREEEDVMSNHYLFPSRPNAAIVAGNHQTLPGNFQVRPSNNPGTPVKIAILDSGVDYQLQQHNVPNQAPLFLWENPAENLNGSDEGDDPFCYVDDLIGWDFINGDNNPMDDNSHGTHVAGILARSLQLNAPNVDYQLMPIKVLDHNGVGTTFEAICGLLYAAEHGADVINLSWGFAGDENLQLTRAMEIAIESGATIVTSSGNDRLDLSFIDHYPSEYSMPGPNNLDGALFAAALDTPSSLWNGTNFRTIAPGNGGLVAFPGVDITSLVPIALNGSVTNPKTGSSMAAPALSALVADYVRLYPDHSPASIRHNLFYLVQTLSSSGQYSAYGNNYDFFGLNWLNIATLYNQHSGAMWTD
ncbi:MAG: S8 family serine peptidase [Bacteroidota bacterium]